jgi:acetylornithine deacetylase/succinyl-diaminopimelate desuccinylase-like protein
MALESIAWDSVEKESIELLSNYIQINTVNPPGNETKGAEFLKNIMEKEGLPCDIYESLPGRGSVISKYKGKNRVPDIILLHHIDVVPAEEKKWIHPPFSGVFLDGEIWGRGSIDCKSLGIMELMAFILLKRNGFSPEKHVVYAATADEEAGGAWGIHWLMKHFPEKLDTKYVINEGAGLGLSTDKRSFYFCQVAEKGACWIRINFEGSPGHGSQPHDDNCVIDMARAIDALGSHKFPVRITETVEKFIYGIASEQGFMPEDEFLGLLDTSRCMDTLNKIPDKTLRQILSATLKNTAVPTVSCAGNKTNVIPSECYCEIDCRILPGYSSEELLKTINDILSKRGCRNFSIDLKGRPRASESSADTPLYKALEMSFKKNDPKAKVVPYMSTGATDSRFFREKGIPAYGIQMITSTDSTKGVHGHNERIGCGQLTMGIKVLYDTIKEFCA